MHLLKPLALLSIAVAIEAADPDPDLNQILFCQNQTIPHTMPEAQPLLDSGECFLLYGIKYNGCYLFPKDYGMEDQSLGGATMGLVCEIYTDTKCKKDGFGYMYQFAFLNRQYKSFRCHCSGKVTDGVCAPPNIDPNDH